MTTARQPIRRQSGAGRTVEVVGDVYRFRATGEDCPTRSARNGMQVLRASCCSKHPDGLCSWYTGLIRRMAAEKKYERRLD